MNIGISFAPASGCNRTQLLVTGNEAISSISLDVDGVISEPKAVTRTPDGIYIDLTKNQLQGLKNGSNAALITDQGYITMTLNGSAKAINGAWRNCETLASVQLTPKQTSQPLQPNSRGPTTADKSFRASEGNIEAIGNVIFVFGSIDSEDASVVKRIAERMRRQGINLRSVVFVKNQGGSLSSAMQLGHTIRALGVNTAAAYDCASACIYAFSGGVLRTSYTNTHFGLHQSRYGDGSVGTLAEGQKIAAIRYGYLESMGVNPKIAIWESEVEPDEIRWISQYEAKGLNLANQIMENYELPSGTRK
ncbi:MAG: hypothetical protein GVY22_04005 [Gammaproteobacteria bacterium]|nr:hypothetical protein [Gammaproteobacteria bacterium]